mmetsp:Transcript_60510/g.129847  ORF Transcript_60510/g.129847 Transcript_60510/m.129847 type:complete len:263 (-) Transcript_60510:118-906(-)
MARDVDEHGVAAPRQPKLELIRDTCNASRPCACAALCRARQTLCGGCCIGKAGAAAALARGLLACTFVRQHEDHGLANGPRMRALSEALGDRVKSCSRRERLEARLLRRFRRHVWEAEAIQHDLRHLASRRHMRIGGPAEAAHLFGELLGFLEVLDDDLGRWRRAHCARQRQSTPELGHNCLELPTLHGRAAACLGQNATEGKASDISAKAGGPSPAIRQHGSSLGVDCLDAREVLDAHVAQEARFCKVAVKQNQEVGHHAE